MKQPHEMTFSEFAESVQPSGGVNRWPQIGSGKEMVSYSVYMNGPLVDQLPVNAREHEYRDVTLHALTEKLGLNANVYRDNMKVAELVATRHAYMTTLLESSIQQQLTPEVAADLDMLLDRFDHPYIKAQLDAQRDLSAHLNPVIHDAEAKLGPIQEQPAGGVSSGLIVSQNQQFSVQDVGNGHVVAHENSRLAEVPAVGQDITVAYYRGKGQLFENGAELKFSSPYVDKQTGDLAVSVTDTAKDVEKVVLFNSMGAIVQFAKEHGLHDGFVQEAMDARIASPKKTIARTVREPVGEPYLDGKSGCIALDYKEGAAIYTACFGSADTLAKNAHEFGATGQMVKRAEEIEKNQNKGGAAIQNELSLRAAHVVAKKEFAEVCAANLERGRYAGLVVAETQFHVVQDVGRQTAVLHDKRNLDKVPAVGQRLSVSYENGRGQVQDRQGSKEHGNGR